DELRTELIAMAEEDLRVRSELEAEGSLQEGYAPRMEEVHRRNAERLGQIVTAHGWPGRSLVGDVASRAAWLVLQHAIGDPSLQRRGLEWLRGAAERGDVPEIEVAMLEDRIRVFEGRPQRYGTQLDLDRNGKLAPCPIEDEAGVDERRARLGLPPMAEMLPDPSEGEAEGARAPFTAEDWERREREREAWLRKVGWR
ncbi:MAG TPA: DUF6624 domain-containing protein, partial [Candidatus Limnocylindrales bacterium]|nr:DUF6624 domain-containing protein [Candidatus Limnocylindrales bacterium]